MRQTTRAIKIQTGRASSGEGRGVNGASGAVVACYPDELVGHAPQPLSDGARPIRWERAEIVCTRCGEPATHNEILHISFCTVHGLQSRLNFPRSGWR